jgi:hypothetical protein
MRDSGFIKLINSDASFSLPYTKNVCTQLVGIIRQRRKSIDRSFATSLLLTAILVHLHYHSLSVHRTNSESSVCFAQIQCSHHENLKLVRPFIRFSPSFGFLSFHRSWCHGIPLLHLRVTHSKPSDMEIMENKFVSESFSSVAWMCVLVHGNQ